MYIKHETSGRAAKTVLALLFVSMMVTVGISTVLSDESDAVVPDYNHYYYDKLDLYENADFTRSVYDAMLTITGPEAEHVIKVPSRGLSISECQQLALLAKTIFVHDNPGMFWINIFNTSSNISGSDYQITFKPAEYTTGLMINTEAEKTKAIEDINGIIDGWGVSVSDSDVVKIEKINKGLAEILDKGQEGTDGMGLRNIATAFLSDDHKVVCAGYSYAFKYCCDKFDIPCICVSGQCSGGPHAWNNVKIGDKWYMVDPMYDDGSDLYRCLLLGSVRSANHVPTLNLSQFPDPENLFPTLSEKGYYQYTVTFKDYNGTTLDTHVYERGEKIDVPKSPARDGYKFDGWEGLDRTPYYATQNETFTAKYVEDGGSSDNGGCNLFFAGIVAAAFSVMAVPLIRYVRL